MKSDNYILINGFKHISYNSSADFDEKTMLEKSEAFLEKINTRRSIRTFSDKPISKKIIENIILSASTAPSGAHKQPWTFCAISNAKLKKKIRIAAEEEEKISYESRMSERWKKDLEKLGTDMNKPFLENAPWLIIAFKKVYELDENNEKQNNYYVNESVGIACGFLIAAIHNAGLVTLTHTPSPMNFLAKILNRPANERAFILFPVGYAHSDTYVPDIERKTLDEVSEFYE
ncbi:Nitroreductase [Halpernia humi]|uniref:Nitroreductase n=1 Tax=Halpernia humi TaxID=493375 RepID=A0A1H6B8G8_9FLAO|nr:nitroreductase family protein [Halpernia humi]SEG56436.1 Nitroreductase [Halpernia humi]